MGTTVPTREDPLCSDPQQCLACTSSRASVNDTGLPASPQPRSFSPELHRAPLPQHLPCSLPPNLPLGAPAQEGASPLTASQPKNCICTWMSHTTHNMAKRDQFALPPVPALGPAPPLLQLSKVAAPLPAPTYRNQDCPFEFSRSLRFPVLTPSRQIHPVRRSPPLEALPDHSSRAPRPAQNPTQKGSQEWTRRRRRIQVCTQPPSSQANPLLY